MANPDRKRNNARKAAAREHQRKHPGMRYKPALNQVSGDSEKPTEPEADTLSTLLEIASVEDVLTRYQTQLAEQLQPGHRWQRYDGVVPLGHTDDGELVSINVGPMRADRGDGPHGAIGGGGDSAYELAALIATTLRAKNAPQNLQVVYADSTDSNGDWLPTGVGDIEFRSTDAQDQFAAWLENELRQRFETAAAAKARDIAQLRERTDPDAETIPPRILVVAIDTWRSTKQWQNALTMLTEMGRAADMFLLLVSPYNEPPAHRQIWSHISYRIALKGIGFGSSSAFDDLLDDEDRHMVITNAADRTAVLGTLARPVQRFTTFPYPWNMINPSQRGQGLRGGKHALD